MTKVNRGLTALMSLFICSIQPALLQAEPSIKRKTFNPDPYVRFTILTSGSIYTLIPKGSIIVLPERHESRIATSKPNGKSVTLKEFISKNYAWISTQELSLEQTRGQAPIPKSLNKSMQDSGRVIIATFKGNPITVLKK